MIDDRESERMLREGVAATVAAVFQNNNNNSNKKMISNVSSESMCHTSANSCSGSNSETSENFFAQTRPLVSQYHPQMRNMASGSNDQAVTERLAAVAAALNTGSAAAAAAAAASSFLPTSAISSSSCNGSGSERSSSGGSSSSTAVNLGSGSTDAGYDSSSIGHNEKNFSNNNDRSDKLFREMAVAAVFNSQAAAAAAAAAGQFLSQDRICCSCVTHTILLFPLASVSGMRHPVVTAAAAAAGLSATHPMHFMRQNPAGQLHHGLDPETGGIAPSALCFCPLHRGFHNSWTIYGLGADGAIHFNNLARDFAK